MKTRVRAVGAAHSARHEPANLITNAQPGASEDLKQRQIRYGLTMAFRVACFISMIWVPSPYRWFLLGAAVVLPYVAVIFANQADQRTDRGTFETGSGDHPGIDRPQPRQLDWAADPEEERERQQAEERQRQSEERGQQPAAEATRPDADEFRPGEAHPWTGGPATTDDEPDATEQHDRQSPRNHD